LQNVHRRDWAVEKLGPTPDHRDMRSTKTFVIVLGVLMLVDGLLLVTGTFATLAKAIQIPLFVSFSYVMYLDNPERFHRPVSRKVAFWSIFGTVATLSALVVLGLVIR